MFSFFVQVFGIAQIACSNYIIVISLVTKVRPNDIDE